MSKITLINGNGKPYNLNLPLIVIHGFINDAALARIEENTGLRFEKKHYNSFCAQPMNSDQITALLMTYNYKSHYYNNSTFKNELHLKSDHHIGYEVDSICFECVKRNHIYTGQLKEGDLLSC